MPTETIVSLTEAKAHLSMTQEQHQDDMLIQDKLDAAQSFIECQLGFRLLDRFDGAHDVPRDLREAILQLAAWWFENREAVIDRAVPLPFGITEIITVHREWTF